MALGLLVTLPLAWRYYWPAGGGLDVTGHPIGRDFINNWVGPQLAFSGRLATLFDLEAYARAIGEVFGATLPFHNWGYPPFALLMLWPLGQMPYFAALSLWTFGLFAAFAGTAASALPPGERARAFVLLALAPACLINTLGGQNGFLTGFLLLGGMLWLDRRPWLAGVLFGLLTYKPHLGLALPFVLIALGAWRTIAAACATALVLVAASVLVFGIEPWRAYLTTTSAFQWLLLERFQGFYPYMMASIYAGGRTFGLPMQAALALQACISLPVLAATVWAVRRTADPRARAALVVCAAPLLTPYAFNYDLTGVAAVAVWRLCDRTSEPVSPWLLAAWLAPTLMMPLNMAGLGIAPALVLAIYLGELRAILARPAAQPAPAGAAG
ncbi:glycosyltransferase family 87 protein [Methylobacterium organophilum]|uniref:glycosyltransferase family 87 protein n=1 Tax=Methylobacterium organophilum TaxID=410 RepID=UPI001EE2032D|nr:glycosyltransferase family 87 protein [Methylobacterium organophilum]